MRLTILFGIFFMISCNSEDKLAESMEQWELGDAQSSKAVLKDKNTCTLNYAPENFKPADIIGKWKNKTYWYLQDNCWYKYEKVEVHSTYEFFDSGKFIRRDSILKSNEELFLQGAYRFNETNDSIRIFFEYNNNGDTLFDQGDTLFLNTLQVFNSGKSLLLGQIDPKPDGNFTNPIVISKFESITTH